MYNKLSMDIAFRRMASSHRAQTLYWGPKLQGASRYAEEK